jgi:hypothetical protein
MKTLPGMLMATALVLAAATDASAYKLSPPDASVHLHGMMTFTPNENGGGHPKPFTCPVTLDLKTKNGEIKTVKFPKGVGSCEGINFQLLPWYIDIFNANSGQFGFTGFISNDGDCGGMANKFQVTKSGVWTFLTGQCLSGTLTSNPPTTIVP